MLEFLCAVCLLAWCIEQCRAPFEKCTQTGDISYRCNLNIHSYWNPCTSIVTWSGQVVSKSVLVHYVELLWMYAFQFILICLSVCLSLSGSLVCITFDLKKVPVLSPKHLPNIYIWMLVYLIYRDAVTICLTMVWYDCMHEIAIRTLDTLSLDVSLRVCICMYGCVCDLLHNKTK